MMSRFLMVHGVRRGLDRKVLMTLLGVALISGAMPIAPASAVLLSTAVPMHQQDTRMWMTSDIDGGSGTVSALDYASDGTLYIGGDFTHVGPPTGGFGAIGPGGTISGAYPYVDGQVYCAVADGSGGFYIGGDFDSVGGVARQNLARINADGTLNVNWNPGANSTVWALASDATYLYVGGNFTTIGGQSYARLARFTRATGVIDPLFSPSPNGMVRALALSGGTLYVGGDFTSIGVSARNRLGAVVTSGATPGQATAWDPSSNGRVYVLTAYSDALYVGGDFTLMGTTALSGIARFTMSTGALVPSWNPVVAGGAVHAIAVQVPTDAASTKVLIGGAFLTVDGTARPRAAALLHSNGELYDSWQPNPNNVVYSILVDGSYVYVGGAFSAAVPSTLPPRLIRFTNDGNLLPDVSGWEPMPIGNGVTCLVASGGDIGVGGMIASVGAYRRNNIAALDSTGAIKAAWYPGNGANGPVRAIEVTNTGRVFVGGEFTTIGLQSRNRMAELSTVTGNPLAFDPNFNGTVYAIESRTGDPIYVGGQFTLAGGASRWNIAALNTSGAATAWCSTGGADNTVRALALDGTGGAIYVGGEFGQILGSNRYRLARLAAASTTLEAWDPALAGVVARVNDVLVTSTAIYAGGQFTTAGGSSRANLAALSPVTAAPTSWAPNPNGMVQALAKSGEADAIIIGGAFTTIGGQDRKHLAAVRPDGTITSWTPAPIYDDVAVLAANDTGVVAGGDFTYLHGDANYGYWQAPVRFAFDDAAPAGTISINGGAASTTSASVTITIGVTDDSKATTQMFSSTSASGPWSMPEPLGTTKSYTLPAGDGTKTVWARFVDESGNIYITSDSITLTTPPPVSLVSVWRFYNGALGTHFYTASLAEKATVMATLSHIYTLEGEAYKMNPAANSATLWRFYKGSTGTHFYTASPTEKADVQANLSHIYTFEGPAYNVSTAFAPGRLTIYRFFHTGNGTHFYTASLTERNNVIATLSHIYNYEGPAFYIAQ